MTNSEGDFHVKIVSPEDLIKSTDEYITQIKGFSNVGKIFICKIPPRCDYHAVNLKVSEFNSLLVERFDNTEEFLEVIYTIKPEIRYFHHDGLHMSNVGLKRLCGIILSKLYKVLLPSYPGADPAQNLTGSNGNPKNFDRHKEARKIFRPARGSWGMLPRKILKIQLLM